MTTWGTDTRAPEKMPTNLKWGLGLLCLQTLLGTAAGVLLMVVAQDAADHGRAGSGAAMMAGILQVAVSAFLTLGAMATRTGWGAVRILVLVLEVVTVAFGFVGLFTGSGITVLPGIVLAVVVARAYGANRAWFNR